MIKILPFLATGVIAISMSGCAIKSENSRSNSTESPAVSVSKKEFELALGNLKVFVDEFDNHTEISSKKTLLTKVQSSHLGFSADLAKNEDEDAFTLAILAAYSDTDDWLFFDSTDLKSKTLSMSIEFPDDLKVEDSHSGYVSELGIEELVQKDIIKLKSLLEEDGEVKVRFNGSGAKAAQERILKLSQKQESDILNVITVYFGLKQGFKLDE